MSLLVHHIQIFLLSLNLKFNSTHVLIEESDWLPVQCLVFQKVDFPEPPPLAFPSAGCISSATKKYGPHHMSIDEMEHKANIKIK